MKVHELIETLKRAKSNKSYGDDLLEKAVMFDLGNQGRGDLDPLAEMIEKTPGHDCKPPFPVSAFQFETKGDIYIALMIDDGSGVSAMGYAFQPRFDAFWWKASAILRVDGYEGHTSTVSLIDLRTGTKPDADWFSDGMETKGWWINHFTFILDLMAAIRESKQVSFIDHPAPSLINKKRLKKGKVPIFPYKTIRVDQDTKPETLSEPATSVRAHSRRGHVRRLLSGKQIWVRPCNVGSPPSQPH